jgi:hypothetical protein
VVTGTPEHIADNLVAWFAAGAADGFNIMPPYLPGGLVDFVEHVVPQLRRRGLFRTQYTDSTLRGHYGLPHPAARALGRVGPGQTCMHASRSTDRSAPPRIGGVGRHSARRGTCR